MCPLRRTGQVLLSGLQPYQPSYWTLENWQDQTSALVRAEFDWSRIPLQDLFHDKQVQEFTGWAIKRVEDFQHNCLYVHGDRGCPPSHAHCETRLLSYIHRNKVNIHPYFGASTATCANCGAMIDGYINTLTDPPLIEVRKYTGRFLDELQLPKFEGEFTSKYWESFVSVLQDQVGRKIINGINSAGNSSP